jgi:hypothetical protein
MKHAMVVVAAFVAILVAEATYSPAAASCTCSKQTNGTFFCTCVDTRGVRYCLSCRSSQNSSCSKVSCR